MKLGETTTMIGQLLNQALCVQLVQLAGRIQRHRKQNVMKKNLFILNQNIRALQNNKVAFTKPGLKAMIKAVVT